MKTKALVEGALLAGLTVIMTILGFFLPLGSFILLITPLPLIVLAARWSSKLSIMASLVNAILLMILINPSLLLLSIFYTGLIGVSMGAAFEEEFSAKLILAVGSIAVIVSFIVSLFVGTYIFNIDILKQLEAGFDLGIGVYQQLGISGETVKELGAQIVTLIKETYPALFLSSGVLVAIVNYYFSAKVLNRFSEYSYPPLLSLEKMRLSKYIAFLYILSIIFNQQIVWKNIYIIANFLVLLEGVAVIYYYILEGRINKLIIILAIIFFPITMQMLLFVGLADILFDFRRLSKENLT
ncbi:putative membrane protein [Halobacteroides halobius DSM 5150]|uniref:Putative membrane protein n=1 Tax=Halobacteroides halobius (strain ATCC 35273 / DSM 5150 / MD-1) TaxID=748449 RepID=L0KEI5_HALHC|nr:DUF2232 domain-containing protein [Halobacteroides halobius]AGB42478.1 putative membrane protein [Halobacteroides halobius DSM 5150]